MMENVPKRMDRDSQAAAATMPAVDYSAPPPLTRRRRASYLGAALLVLTVLGGGYVALLNTSTLPVAELSDAEEQGDPPGSGFREYRKWDRPELAIVLSGEMHGYIH